MTLRWQLGPSAAARARVVGVAVEEPVEDRGEVVALIEQLEQAGWSIGGVALRGEGVGLV